MILIVFFIFFLFAQKAIVFLGFTLKFRKAPEIALENLPSVSILIPARNEEVNLPGCLESMLRLHYPSDKLEIIVGNDQSTDKTPEVTNAYTDRYEHIGVAQISHDYHGLVARSNVLAQLAARAKGDYLVFLDADMEVTPGWLRQMVAPTTDGFKLVSGYTEVKGHGWFSGVQQMDWLNVIMMLKVGADIGQPGTALGNNMLVNKEAYLSVGGYEQIGPTFTEDNDLTLTLRKQGHEVFQLTTRHGAYTLPIHTYAELLKQRNRWMQGAFKQPLYRLLPLICARVFMLWVILLMMWDYRWGLVLMLQMTFMDAGLALVMSQKTKTQIRIYIALLAPVFNSLLDTFTLLSYPWNRHVIWKGRKL